MISAGDASVYSFLSCFPAAHGLNNDRAFAGDYPADAVTVVAAGSCGNTDFHCLGINQYNRRGCRNAAVGQKEKQGDNEKFGHIGFLVFA